MLILLPIFPHGCNAHRPMGTMKCLACGHDNRAGEESCVSCSASLTLKPCGHCEAINAEDAARCHSCGAERSLPSAWVISDEPGAQRRGLRAALWAVPVLAFVGLGAYHASSGLPEAQAVTAPAAVELKVAEPSAAPEPPKALPSNAIPRVTHTRGPDSASSGGASATGSVQ